MVLHIIKLLQPLNTNGITHHYIIRTIKMVLHIIKLVEPLNKII